MGVLGKRGEKMYVERLDRYVSDMYRRFLMDRTIFSEYQSFEFRGNTTFEPPKMLWGAWNSARAEQAQGEPIIAPVAGRDVMQP